MQLVQLVDKVKKGAKSDFVLSDDWTSRFRTRLCVPSDEDLRRKFWRKLIILGLSSIQEGPRCIRT